jgi:mannitol/fructose-specific phosphotransferase system IIA component (Ntr-type)
MRLSELLREEQILLSPPAKDKGAMIAALVDALAAQGRLEPGRKAAVLEALLAREKIASTGMEHGIAIPHASVDGLPGPLAMLALCPAGVPFQSADGQPARLLVLLVIPRAAVTEHARTLAGIAKLLQYEELREALLRARSPREALGIIREEEQRG